jgi:multisubunit Na+/H+ antiporter MnhC subunit
MFRALRPYLNAFLIGFILTFVIYLFIRFNASDIVLGMVIAAVGGAALLVAYVYLDRKFGQPEVVYDRDGNPVRR